MKRTDKIKEFNGALFLREIKVLIVQCQNRVLMLVSKAIEQL
jgi:hypothetical protein